VVAALLTGADGSRGPPSGSRPKAGHLHSTAKDRLSANHLRLHLKDQIQHEEQKAANMKEGDNIAMAFGEALDHKVDDDKKLLPFFDKRMATEVAGDSLGDEFKGYVFRISGGNDKQGFPMKQGILCNHRVRLLFKKGMSCYRERRSGCRKRKSVRGCVVGPDLAVLHLVMVKKGAEEIPGLTDDNKPRRLGPKRASNIRKLFGLEKKDDVRQFVVRRELNEKKKKAPKIQRLITPSLLQRKRYFKALTRRRMEAGKQMKADYMKRVAEYRQEQKEARAAEVAKKKKEKK